MRGRPAPPRVGDRRASDRRAPKPRAGQAALHARARLRGFRKATMLAVALTALFLLVFAVDENGGAARLSDETQLTRVPDQRAVAARLQTASSAAGPADPVRADALAAVATEEAFAALRGLWISFVGNLPKYLIAIAILAMAAVLVRFVRRLLRRALRNWERSNAAVALAGVAIWLLALGIAISVLVGDIRALVGSLGLVGLALSWALQTPIESFTGWLMNSFQGYYRVGDRVAVGEVFGDVYRIDFLTTTVWEIGGVDRSTPMAYVRSDLLPTATVSSSHTCGKLSLIHI